MSNFSLDGCSDVADITKIAETVIAIIVKDVATKIGEKEV